MLSKKKKKEREDAAKKRTKSYLWCLELAKDSETM